mmetsp:Transcript_25508/g.42735  ORF Transcript_25508/g.42735 Transcript_25508/m.42735 type:complete len:201 (+) Transcript_25508:396-998(+)|eukprot:CAMPEP_0198205952 /NCGR_PEP_ID=MMETSP1445-20131203/9479_1 /TAXON_ID=36898 /ORGANISM="Pyramimonas sp., Strain CCMP2087" /LENGTH=200 /DNA_ID=CAMNT_0043878449 /DNA_START=304 /DNA_END=906 /DNA_ORIENTATION=-
MAARKEMTDWSHYEALLPKPSHSNVGRYVDCSHVTIPQVRSYLRSEAYERTTTQPQQSAHDAKLSVPKRLDKQKIGQGAQRALKQKQLIAESRTKASAQSKSEYFVPELSKRVLPPVSSKLRTRPPREPRADQEWDESYSETPIHIREHQGKVFDLPPFVCKERAIITAGRTFTWGGRMKLQLPGYDPLRAKNLTASTFI